MLSLQYCHCNKLFLKCFQFNEQVETWHYQEAEQAFNPNRRTGEILCLCVEEAAELHTFISCLRCKVKYYHRSVSCALSLSLSVSVCVCVCVYLVLELMFSQL